MLLNTVAEALETNSALRGGKRAVTCVVTGVELTHASLHARSRRLAVVLASRGVRRGERVAVFGRNSVVHVEVYAAAALSGFVVVPINPGLTKGEATEILRATQAVAAVSRLAEDVLESDDWEFEFVLTGMDYIRAAWLPPDTPEGVSLQPSAMDDPWVVLFTSGTSTGRPKGVVRSQGGSVLGFFTHTGPMHFSDDTVGLVAFPFHGISSFFFGFLYLYIGASVVIVDLQREHVATIIRVIEDHQVTFATMAPRTVNEIALLPDRPPCSSVRAFLLTGASSSKVVKDVASEVFRNASLFDAYGSSEAGLITLMTPEHMAAHSDSVGMEAPGTRLCKLVDSDGEEVAPGEVGRVTVRTPMMFLGYLSGEADAPPAVPAKRKRGNPRPGPLATVPSLSTVPVPPGFFDQGDLACRREGCLYLMGRSDDMIVHPTGYKIYPVEMEQVLHRIPGVHDVYVVGLPSNAKAETVGALILADPSEEAGLAQKVRDSMASVSPVRKPDTYLVKPLSFPLPKTATGKVRKTELARFFVT
ncbi:2-succinylbenzoate--CoA ligase [Diplonema papillatum]|nr:2-succinylbenzoate--CoA ligase [Diplonema papillatum]|eukprot:gene3471-5433_t